MAYTTWVACMGSGRWTWGCMVRVKTPALDESIARVLETLETGKRDSIAKAGFGDARVDADHCYKLLACEIESPASQ